MLAFEQELRLILVWTAHLGNTAVGYSPERLIEAQTTNRTERKCADGNNMSSF